MAFSPHETRHREAANALPRRHGPIEPKRHQVHNLRYPAARLKMGSDMTSYRILLSIALSLGFAQQALAQSSSVPAYRGNELLFPDGFRNWMFVDSNLGLLYKGEQPSAPTFHNIYLDPEAYSYFRDAGQFPDPTMLVMDIYESKDREEQGIVTKELQRKMAGQFCCRQGFDTSARPERREDDLGLLHVFPDRSDPAKPSPSAAAQADKNCENCHRDHAKVDHVWVQFYPVLRALTKK
jgi:hypothetical protein